MAWASALRHDTNKQRAGGPHSLRIERGPGPAAGSARPAAGRTGRRRRAAASRPGPARPPARSRTRPGRTPPRDGRTSASRTSTGRGWRGSRGSSAASSGRAARTRRRTRASRPARTGARGPGRVPGPAVPRHGSPVLTTAPVPGRFCPAGRAVTPAPVRSCRRRRCAVETDWFLTAAERGNPSDPARHATPRRRGLVARQPGRAARARRDVLRRAGPRASASCGAATCCCSPTGAATPTSC